MSHTSTALPSDHRASAAAAVYSGGLWFLALVAAIPIAISLVAPSQSAAGWQTSAWRAGSLGLVFILGVMAQFRFKEGVRFARLFAPWMLVLLFEAVIRFGEIDAWNEVFRHTITLVIGAIVYQAAGGLYGRMLTRQTLWLVLLFVLGVCLVLAGQMIQGGWSWDRARVFKLASMREHGIAFNTLLFIAAMCLAVLAETTRMGRWVWLSAFVVFAMASILFATRAPLISIMIGWGLAVGYRRWLARQDARAKAASLGIVGAVILAIPLALVLMVKFYSGSVFAHFAAGRIALWKISVAEFAAHPVVGVGPNALVTGVQDFLNVGGFTQQYERDTIVELTGGGFHNLWLDTLASKGFIGFLGLFFSYFALIRSGLSATTSAKSVAAITLLFALLSRSYVEVSGIMGYQNSALDFVAIVALALCLRDANAVSARERAEGRAPQS